MVSEGGCMEHEREWCVRVSVWNMSVNGECGGGGGVCVCVYGT